jgi:hypothetical protein
MDSQPAGHLVILNDPTALAWVLRNQRMAFPASRLRQAERLGAQHTVFLYMTRGCLGRPAESPGRVIAQGSVVASAERLDSSVRLSSVTYDYVVSLRLGELAPLGAGVELAKLVAKLDVFPIKHAWTSRMRRTVLPLPDADVVTLRDALESVVMPHALTVKQYQEAAKRLARPNASGTARAASERQPPTLALPDGRDSVLLDLLAG